MVEILGLGVVLAVAVILNDVGQRDFEALAVKLIGIPVLFGLPIVIGLICT